MPTALADPPAAPSEQQPAHAASAGGLPTPAPSSGQAPARHCTNCGAALTDGQDWCLQCGTGAPDSLRSRAPSWRSAAAVIAALVLLVAAAGGAAYAALSKGNGRRTATVAVAQAPAPAATTPVQPASGEVPQANVGTPTTIKPSTPLGSTKPPKIPLSVPTPTTPAAIPVTPTPAAKLPVTKTRKSGGKQAPVPAGEAHPEALMLDTNAAATYNPYNYAAGNFGDPSLAIDGDASTGWTALVEPANAPKLAEGLIVDLNTARRLSGLALTTTTPGMTIQLYGANAPAPPASITDPAWIALTPSLTEGRRHARIKFGAGDATARQNAAKPYRFIVLWISQAPASAVGTPAAPGRVSVNELELFAARKK